jgi:hypothetical protein
MGIYRVWFRRSRNKDCKIGSMYQFIRSRLHRLWLISPLKKHSEEFYRGSSSPVDTFIYTNTSIHGGRSVMYRDGGHMIESRHGQPVRPELASIPSTSPHFFPSPRLLFPAHSLAFLSPPQATLSFATCRPPVPETSCPLVLGRRVYR